MKLHSFPTQIIIFLIIFMIFIVPPFFVLPGNVNSESFTVWPFPGLQLLQCLLMGLLYFICKDLHDTQRFPAIKKYRFFYTFLFPFINTLGFLLAFSFFVKFLAIVTKNVNQNVAIKIPGTAKSWIFCILSFIFSGLYEEFLYRFFFPQGLKTIFLKKFNWNNKLTFWVSESIGLIVFAFAHIYLGWFSVLNAAIAHVILRLCYKFSGNPWSGSAAHIIYNIISLILL